eukprot:CAMPEP_0172208048 /NCGR_PEP_ID=MMETSP1050-20130122/34223_1 /TAXON_ID=233186 /ORGANISM="Cryptomonas curvata, Strain CCAP979/52" /LENGTH=758 /DNA_ID=CAMNT_0012887531 /DNA_START=382 /DNA_END=2658 /DNA_ORIENTATION=-
MPGVWKINPMASEFKLNPGATEFVPCFGQSNAISATATTSQLELKSQEKCSQKQVISSVEDEHVNCEHPCEGSADLTPVQPQQVTESLHHGMMDRANFKSFDSVRTSRKDSSAKSSTRTLPRIASGENLADLELDFHEMILQSPCDKQNCLSNQDDLNPIQIWCGEEPPQLVWSRSADDLELPAEIININQEEISDEQISEPYGNADEEPLKRSQKQSRKRISSKGDEGISSKVEEGATTGEDPVPQTKSKITVDDFEILCMVGEGGFGKVFQVRKKDTSLILAMKCMRKDCVMKDNFRGTKNERHILSSVRHPYIVNMHYAFQCKGRLYLIMDYFPGGQFLDLLQHHAPFNPDAYTLYTGEIVLALAELHGRGIVHRDLKPENILVDSQGHLVITDFGCSKMSDENGSVRTASWAGTELYMAPEQLQKAEYGAEVDWWALGALVWEMCTGANPFYHSNRKVMHNNILKKKLVLPSWLHASVHSFLKALLSRDPAKRLGTAGGAVEVKGHAFFKGFNFKSLMARELPAPLRSHAKSGDMADTSGHSDRYTKARPMLSPVPSPAILSSSNQALFCDFDWCPDLPAQAAPSTATSRVLSSGPAAVAAVAAIASVAAVAVVAATATAVAELEAKDAEGSGSAGAGAALEEQALAAPAESESPGAGQAEGGLPERPRTVSAAIAIAQPEWKCRLTIGSVSPPAGGGCLSGGPLSPSVGLSPTSPSVGLALAESGRGSPCLHGGSAALLPAAGTPLLVMGAAW